MGSVVYTQPNACVATYTFTGSALTAAAYLELGALPKGIILHIDVEKQTAFNNSAVVRLNNSGSSSDNIATSAEVAATAAGMASVTNWRTALPALVRASQQYLYAYLVSGTPNTGTINVYVTYLPADMGY